MTQQARLIFDKAFNLKKAANELDSEEKFKEADELFKEADEFLETLCPECSGFGEIPKAFMPSNPNLIDEPYKVCSCCHGSGLAE